MKLDLSEKHFSYFPVFRKPIDLQKKIPHWEPPTYLHEVNMPQSSSSTANFLDAVVRKVNMLHEEFRGDRQPMFMRHKNSLSQDRRDQSSILEDEEKTEYLPEIEPKPKKKNHKRIMPRI
jgi:hypothetical protein